MHTYTGTKQSRLQWTILHVQNAEHVVFALCQHMNEHMLFSKWRFYSNLCIKMIHTSWFMVESEEEDIMNVGLED
jgi:hypothetical protein